MHTAPLQPDTDTAHSLSPRALLCPTHLEPSSHTTIKANSLTGSNICGQAFLAFDVLEHSSVVWPASVLPFSGVVPQKARTASFYALLLLKFLISHHHVGSVHIAESPYTESLFSGLIFLI